MEHDPKRSNMTLWNAVKMTDPDHTKAVSFGARKFTSIDAMYQIQRATEQFGPVGQGWGYRADYDTRDGLVFCQVRVWHGDPANWFGPVMACNVLRSEKGKVDEDAPKKALTDALTKALSHLGFSADVFLGLFDDNAYVQRASKEATLAKYDSTITAMLKAIDDNDAGAALEAWDELEESEKGVVWREFNTKQKSTLRDLFNTARGENVETAE